MDNIIYYQVNNLDFSVLSNRLAVIKAVFNAVGIKNLPNTGMKIVHVNYSSGYRAKYTYTKLAYTEHVKYIVEEVSTAVQNNGIYRQYYRIDDDDFVQTQELRNVFGATSFTGNAKTISGITISGFSVSYYPDHYVASGQITVNSNKTLTPDFQIGDNYYYVFYSFDTDAEEFFSNSTSAEGALTSLRATYVNDDQLYATSGYKIVKRNGHIYMAFSTTNSTLSLTTGYKAVFLAFNVSGDYRKYYFK